jgi:hypothetical protein
MEREVVVNAWQRHLYAEHRDNPSPALLRVAEQWGEQRQLPGSEPALTPTLPFGNTLPLRSSYP